VEFVGSLPLLLMGALACVQALLLAISLILAQSVADRAARGATGSEALASVPVPWRDRTSVGRTNDGDVTVRIRTPTVLPGTGARLRVEARSGAVQ